MPASNPHSAVSPLDSATSPVLRRRVLVSGRVQGVGYRQTCAEVARRNGVQGWVRNRRDRRVEALLEGPAPAVHAVIEWCRQGPLGAVVSDVEVVEETGVEVLVGFRIASTV